MTPISGSRLVLSGVAWFVAYNLLTGLAWLAFLRRWGLPEFHPALGSAEPLGTEMVASLLTLTLAMGIFAMWLYAGLRPRFAGNTFAYVGVALWVFWGLLPTWPSTLPSGSLVLELLSKLAVLVAATAIGGAIYRDTPLPSREEAQERA